MLGNRDRERYRRTERDIYIYEFIKHLHRLLSVCLAFDCFAFFV